MKIEKSVIDKIVALQFGYIGKDPVESMKDPSWRTKNESPIENKSRWNSEGIEILISEIGISRQTAEVEMSWVELRDSIKYV